MNPLSASITLPLLPLLLLLLLIITLFQTPAARIQNDFTVPFFECPNITTNYYTSGSQFEFNLKNLLFPSLISNGSPKSFFNTSSGTDSDKIYGLVQCSPDVSAADCQDCLKSSTDWSIKNCLNRVDATIRSEKCMLRYSNTRFFSEFNTSDLIYVTWYLSNDIPQTSQAVFNQQMKILWNNLSSTASLQPSKFMADSISYNSLREIYGSVDCTQDLSSADCLLCLQLTISIIQQVPGCCSGKEGGWVLTRSCEIMYTDAPLTETLPSPPGLPFLQPPITVPWYQSSQQPPISIPRPFSPGSKGSQSSPSIVVFIGSTLVGAAVYYIFFNIP